MISRFARRRLRQATEGAAAIEYGLLAAAIGLGIVAALVASKGSLNGTYSRIAGQFPAAVLDPGQTPMGAYWAAKTLKDKTTRTDSSGNPTITYTFADGSTVVATSTPGQAYLNQFTLTDTANNQTRSEYYNPAGGLAFMQVTQRNAAGGFATVQYSYGINAVTLTGDPPQGNYSYTQNNDTNGGYVSTVGVVGAVYAKAATSAADESAYFAKLSGFP